MEYILLDVAVEVAKHLSPRDISSCCAVSSHWRQVFGANEVWRGLCDSEIEEYLRTTPCVVEPVFTLIDHPPSLGPLSHWRAAFLREQHLWRNWRKGNVKTMEHKMNYYSVDFITNDFIVTFDMNSIELWAVKANTLVKKNAFLFGENMCLYSPTVFENGIVVITSYLGDFIWVFKVDVQQCTISLGWQIELFENHPKCYSLPKPICSNNLVVNSAHSLANFDIIFTTGRCVGYFPFSEGSNSFYVWDLENGIQLKKEFCHKHLLGGGMTVVGCKSGAKTCQDVIVLTHGSITSTPSGAVRVVSIECRVYSVQQLNFLPFKQRSSVFDYLLPTASGSFGCCAITNNFLALCDCGNAQIESIRIFNYQSGHLLHKLNAISHTQVISDSSFIFTKLRNFERDANQKTAASQITFPFEEDEKCVLCSVSCLSEVFIEDMTGSDINNFLVMGKGLVEVFPANGSSEVWRVDKLSSFKTGITFPGFTKVNRAFTMFITLENEEKIFRITHLW